MRPHLYNVSVFRRASGFRSAFLSFRQGLSYVGVVLEAEGEALRVRALETTRSAKKSLSVAKPLSKHRGGSGG